MFKKFLCVFAMALLFVACDGKSNKKSSDDDDDDKKEFNTGYAVLDDGLERLNKVCKKVKKVETLYELEVLEDELKEVGSKWEEENEEELQKLKNTEAEEIFEEEFDKIKEVFHKKRAELRENSDYGCDSTKVMPKAAAAPVCDSTATRYYEEPYYYADSVKYEAPAEAPVEATEYYDEPYYY